MIRVNLYFASGSLQSSHDCETAGEAFERLQRSNMDGLAFLADTTCGGYEWRARQEGHTLEGFKATLALCCNDAGEYSKRLIKAGVCTRRLDSIYRSSF